MSMKNDDKPKWTLMVIIIILSNLWLSLAVAQLADSLQPSQEITSANGAWQMENGWKAVEGDLVGSGPSRASYVDSCKTESQTFKFNLKSLQGELHTEININGSNLYAIGFVNNGNGSISTYLIKQMGSVSPAGIENETIPGQSMRYDHTQEYLAEIVSKNGRIQVYLSEKGLRSADLIPLIDYSDPTPLSPGDIAFEILQDSNARINEMDIICSSASSTRTKAPDLGVGHFKRPT
jgi:hypothetical protein